MGNHLDLSDGEVRSKYCFLKKPPRCAKDLSATRPAKSEREVEAHEKSSRPFGKNTFGVMPNSNPPMIVGLSTLFMSYGS